MDRPAGRSRTLKQILNTIEGEYVWGLEIGFGRVLRMNFGKPYLRVREPIYTSKSIFSVVKQTLERRQVIPTGKWHLFVDDGSWAIYVKDAIATKYDDRTHVGTVLQQLDGQRLVRSECCVTDGTLNLLFDLGGRIHVKRSMNSEELDWPNEVQWMLFLENKRCYFVQNDTALGFESSRSQSKS